MDISFASAALYYGMYLLGAGSIGYLLVRLSYPDIRLLDKDAKLGVSAILGFFIMCVSIAVEWAAGHAADFGLGLSSYQGLMPLFSCLLIIVTFGIMKVYFFVNSPRMLTVGLPIHSASKAAKAMDSPAPFAQAAGQQAFRPFDQADAPKSAAAVPFPSRTVVSVITQPSGLFGFVDLLFKKHVPQVVQKKQELIEIDVPIVQRVAGERQQPSGQKSTTVQFTSIDLSEQENSSAGQKQQAQPVKVDANVPAPFVSGLQQKGFVSAKASAGQKPPEKVAPRPSFASRAAPFVSGITPDMVAPANYSRQKPSASKSVLDEDVPKDERSRKDYYDRKINELLSGFPSEDTERKIATSVAAKVSVATPVAGEAAKPDDASSQSFPSKPAAPAKSRKELEMESELMIDDLVPAGSQKPSALAVAPESATHRMRPYEQAAESEVPSAESSSPSESRRRLYAKSSSIRVIAPRDVSETDEFADIITDIYSQLKSSSREDSLNNSMMVNVPPSSSEKSQSKAGAAKGKFDDLEGELFGTSKPVASSSASGGGVFDQLSRISAVEGPGKTPASESGLKSSSDMEFVHIGNEAGMGCPTCHQKNSRIVFCPYCGSGMCTNCSPNVQVDAGGFVYSCPKCGEEVHIKKKAATPSGSSF